MLELGFLGLRRLGAPVDRKAKILLADLFYVNRLTRNRLCVPLNIGYVSTYSDQLYGNDIDISLYKDVDLLLEEIVRQKPDIVGFSFYYWNQNLNYYVVEKLRELYGDQVLVVFGGPSVDSDEAEQMKLFLKFPQVDIFVEGEGEAGFAAILDRVLGDRTKLYDSPIDCSLFMRDDQLVKGLNTSTNLDLTSVPSPYLNGILDEFLEAEYMPLLQATRTCPYQCTFCVEGKERSRLRAFPLDQVKQEIDYVVDWNRDRPHVVLNLAELNFGIHRQDAEIATYLREKAESVGYPRSVYFYQDKKFKESGKQVITALGNLNKNGLCFSLQTEHPEGVIAIKRKNLSDGMIEDGINWAKERKIPVSTELIFGLPYETYDSMVATLNRCVDQGFDQIMLHNLFLMEGIELAREPELERWGIGTDYRLLGNNYAMFDDKFVFEYEKMVTSNKYFDFADFVNIRCLNLMFYSVFQGSFYKYFFHYVKGLGIPLASFFHAFMNPTDGEQWPSDYQKFVGEYRKSAVEELYPDLEALGASARQIYLANDGVGEPVRLNPYFYSRLMYTEQEWVPDVLLKILMTMVPNLDEQELGEAQDILELCGQLIVDLRNLDSSRKEVAVNFDPNAWREDKFHGSVREFATNRDKVSLYKSPDQIETLDSFVAAEGDLVDDDFYFVAVETLMPRTILFYEIDSSGLNPDSRYTNGEELDGRPEIALAPMPIGEFSSGALQPKDTELYVTPSSG